MPRRQAILYNANNFLRTATITGTAPKASVNTVRPIPTERAGSGKVQLLPNPGYTGAADAQIDVRISAGGSTPRVSSPVYSGSGNGTMTDLAVDSAINEQTFTCVLRDLGTDSAYAEVPFFHGTLRARSIGSGGNSIMVSVDSGNTGGTIGPITKTATSFSVLDDIPANTQRLAISGRNNAEFNYGGLALISNGKLDPATPRIQFGSFPKVYRQYFRNEKGDTVYYLDDETSRLIPAGTIVYNVTGGYRVVVSDGVTTEEYKDVVTIFDLLSRLLASQLVEFYGVVTKDQTPDGMASAEMDLRTSSIALNPIPAYTDANRTPALLTGVSAPAAAPTQTVTIQCTDNSRLGEERWAVSGTNSNALGTAITGSAFTSSALNFTIPYKSPSDATGADDSSPIEGDVTVKGQFQANDGIADTFPTVCLDSYVLGPNARPMTITMTLEKKPSDECACGTTGVSYPLNPRCVGADSINFQSIGGTGVAEAIHADIKSRYDAIYDWYQSSVANLIAINDPASPSSVETNDPQFSIANNVRLFGNIRDLFIAALNGLANAKDQGVIDASGLASALTEYDGVKTALDSDAELATIDNLSDTSPNLITSGNSYVEYYRAELNRVYTGAGVVPNYENDSTVGGAPCWFDDESATEWWRVETSEGQQWAYWHTGYPYYSVVERRENGAIVYERLDILGVNLEVNCAGSLQVGDTITISILGSENSDQIADNRFYQVGDKWTVDVMFGQDVALQGGVSGDNTHTWAISGSDLGALADYAVVHGSEALYNNGGGGEVSFRIYRGGRNASLGDKITFSVQKARYEWRKDGGSWSTIADLPAAAVTLTDGLDIQFNPGVIAPNWSDQDIYSFDVIARFKHAHMQAPGHGAYQFDGSTATVVFDLGSDQDIDIVAFPVLQDLPDGASIDLRGLDASDVELWTHTMTERDGMLIDWFEPANTTRKLEITLTDAVGVKIGWVFAGSPVMPIYACVNSYISPAYLMGGDTATAQLFFGAGNNGEFQWERSLNWTDLQALYDLVSYVKRNNNQPVVAISDPNQLDIIAMMRIDTDQLRVAHVENLRQFDRAITDNYGRGASLTLPFAPVYQS